MATEKDHMKIVVHLVDKGAEINTIDDAGVSVYRESVDLNLSSLLSQLIYCSCGVTVGIAWCSQFLGLLLATVVS